VDRADLGAVDLLLSIVVVEDMITTSISSANNSESQNKEE
jgi:hypothetical protein